MTARHASILGLRVFGCAAAGALLSFSLLADETDEASCLGHDLGDRCTLETGAVGICQADDVDEDGLECDAPELHR